MSIEVLERTKMPSRSFMVKKYSHCPLKKRPVAIFKDVEEDKDADDVSEPENLSTKPQDLSLKSSSPPPGLMPISRKLLSDGLSSPDRGSHLTAFTLPSRDNNKSVGVLEPLNLNTPAEQHHHHHHQQHHPVATYRPTPQYPPQHYLPFPYHYTPHDMYHPTLSLASNYHQSLYHQQVSPVRSHQSEQSTCVTSPSPPHMLYTPPLRPLPHRPNEIPYPPSAVDHCGLSPTSSTSSRSPPPATPEDLSSPGSVASSGSVGSAGMGSSSKRRKESAPRYQCPDCNKSYSTYSGLSKHQQFHCSANEASQAKKSFSCKYCEKVYVSLGALKMHIRTHTLPCKCTVCGKAFSRPWLLQGHVRTHTGEKPFSCQHCGRAFADRSNLRAHLQTHSDVKKYSCLTCSKTFSRMSLLTKHGDGGCPGVHQHDLPYHHQNLSLLKQEHMDI